MYHMHIGGHTYRTYILLTSLCFLFFRHSVRPARMSASQLWLGNHDIVAGKPHTVGGAGGGN